ncbi:MAG: Fic family protein [Prevotellaceae bacterium]|jgi:cell filamentation protein|nr:Fic family protein [Prevotellaceae bacterium]
MPNKYRYIDPEYIYTDPETGVLRNLAGVTDHDRLAIIETGVTTKRANELHKNPLKINGANALLDIHHYLFQDIYSWAGKLRTVEISKDGKPFFPVKRFNKAFSFIDALISEYRQIDRNDRPLLARKLAEILDAVNYLHPFREGNGRTQRELLRLLALEKGQTLHLNPPDNADIYERYMSGTVNGDVEILTSLIAELISENQK